MRFARATLLLSLEIWSFRCWLERAKHLGRAMIVLSRVRSSDQEGSLERPTYCLQVKASLERRITVAWATNVLWAVRSSDQSVHSSEMHSVFDAWRWVERTARKAWAKDVLYGFARANRWSLERPLTVLKELDFFKHDHWQSFSKQNYIVKRPDFVHNPMN